MIITLKGCLNVQRRDLTLLGDNNNSSGDECFSGTMLISVHYILAYSTVWLPLCTKSDVPLLLNTEKCVCCYDYLLLFLLLLVYQQYHGTAKRSFTIFQIPDYMLGIAVWEMGGKGKRISSLHKQSSGSHIL